MEKLTYVRFLPSGHYGAAEPTISDEKCEPYSKDVILEAYKGASCTSWSMGGDEDDPDSMESLFDEYGDFGCFNSVYVFSKNSPELEGEIRGLMWEFDAGGSWDDRENTDIDDYAGYLFSKDLSDNYLFSYDDDGITVYDDALDEVKFKIKLPDTPSRKKPKNELYDLLDCIADSDIRELVNALISNNNFTAVDYLMSRRGFSEEDLEDLKLMSRMKRRSKYT